MNVDTLIEDMNDNDEVEILEVSDNYRKEVENEEELRLSGSECEEFTEEARKELIRESLPSGCREISRDKTILRTTARGRSYRGGSQGKRRTSQKKELKQKNITETVTKGTIKMKENNRLLEQDIEADEKGQMQQKNQGDEDELNQLINNLEDQLNDALEVVDDLRETVIE